MTKLFVDCEFNEFQGELISMAIVSEDGREWCEALPCANPGPWVSQHVMPIIGKQPLQNGIELALSLTPSCRSSTACILSLTG